MRRRDRRADWGAEGWTALERPDAGSADRETYRTGEKATPTIVPCAGPCLNLVTQVGIPETL